MIKNEKINEMRVMKLVFIAVFVFLIGLVYAAPQVVLNEPQNNTTFATSLINLSANFSDTSGLLNSTIFVYNQNGSFVNSSSSVASPGNALVFDKVNDYLLLNSNLGLSGTKNITVSVWLKDASVYTGSVAGIFTDASDNTNDFVLILHSNGIYYFGNNAGDTSISTTNKSGWHHLVGRYNSTHYQIFYDGIAVGTPFATTVTLPAENFIIGLDRGWTSMNRWFGGSMDEFLIFNRSLSSAEISQLYNLGSGFYANTSIDPFNSGLVAGYHFDNSSGDNSTYFVDITGRYNATCSSTACPTYNTGKIASVTNITTSLNLTTSFTFIDGIYNWFARAVNLVANSNITENRTFGINIVAPTISLVNNTYTNSKNLNANFYDGYRIRNVTLQIYDSNNSEINNSNLYVQRSTGSITYNYTGADQIFTVPENVTSINIKMWGAGGGGGSAGGWSYGFAGGAGGYTGGIVNVTPGQNITVMVGGGGTEGSVASTNPSYGGGARSCNTGSDCRYGAQGGGRSALRIGSEDIATAGGGGGGGSSRSNTGQQGGAGGGLTANDGVSYNTGCRGRGATSTSAGVASSCANANGAVGAKYTGGNPASNAYGGAGGGGYYGGGGGGYGEPNDMGGGGGGSSYLGSYDLTTIAGSGTTPGNSADSDRETAGNGGAANTAGSNGRILISYTITNFESNDSSELVNARLSNIDLETVIDFITEGVYTLAFNVIDFGDLVNQTNYTITYDTTSPNVTLISPDNMNFTNNSVVNFTANISDNLGLKNLTLNLYNMNGILNRSSNLTYGEGNLSLQARINLSLANGIYNWSMIVFDLAGNYNTTENRTIVVDSIAPNTSTSFTNNTLINLGDLNDSITLSDNTSGLQNATIYIYNGSGFVNSTSYNWSIGNSNPFNNYALSFDGSNDYVKLSSITNISENNNFTISSWVKLNSMPTSDAWPSSWSSHMVVLGRGTASLGDGWDLIIGQTKLIFQSNDVQIVSGNHGMSINNWYHLSVTRSGNIITLFVNGNQVAQTTSSSSFGIGSFSWMGCETGEGAWMNGNIDEVLIFNRSLNSTEISQLYNSGNGLYANTSIAPFNSGLVAGYHLDEGNGTTAYDITGVNNGTLTNGPTYVTGKVKYSDRNIIGTIVESVVSFPVILVSGVYTWFINLFDWAGNEYTTQNQTFDLDAYVPNFTVISQDETYNTSASSASLDMSANVSEDRFLWNVSLNIYNSSGLFRQVGFNNDSVPAGSALTLSGGTYVGTPISAFSGDVEVTLSAWVKTTSGTSSSGIVGTGESTCYGTQGLFFYDVYPAVSAVFGTGQCDQGASLVSGTTPINDGQWHFVVATHSATNNILYVDGNQEAIGTSGSLGGATGTYTIGKILTDWNWDGQIDEVNIWNRALSSEEVSNMYNSYVGIYGNIANPPFNSGLIAGYHLDEGSGSSISDFSGNGNTGTISQAAGGSCSDYSYYPGNCQALAGCSYYDYQWGTSCYDSNWNYITYTYSWGECQSYGGYYYDAGYCDGTPSPIVVDGTFIDGHIAGAYGPNHVTFTPGYYSDPVNFFKTIDFSESSVYTWFFEARDSAGNIGTSGNRSVIVDRVKPTINSKYFSPNSTDELDPNMTIAFYTNLTDSMIGVNTAILQVYNGSWKNYTLERISGNIRNGIYSANVSLSENDKNYTYNVWVNDSLGNWNVSSDSTFSANWEYTWNASLDFSEAVGRYNQQKYIGNLTINNTGDWPLSFYYFNDNAPYGDKLIYDGRSYVPEFILTSDHSYKDVRSISLNTTFGPVDKNDTVTMVIKVREATSSPKNTSLVFNLTSFPGGPYLESAIDVSNISVYQSNNLTLGAYVRNIGDEYAHNLSLNWTLPIGMSNISGNTNSIIYENLTYKEENPNNYTLRSDLISLVSPTVSAGTYTYYFTASGSNGTSTTPQTTINLSRTIIVYCNSMDDICGAGCSFELGNQFYDNDCSAPGIGSSGSGGGGGGGSDGGSFDKSSAVFELVR